jgi:dihydrofolate synthase/folylpolyglutamate synthase
VSESPSASAQNPRQASQIGWLESLSPWPVDGFGLERITALLDRLGNPQRLFAAIHVVGTNGKSTTARTIARLLAAEGLRTASYLSPHVTGWHERLDTDAEGIERALARVRPYAEAVGATQFETLTAAAFADFAARGVQVAAVEAGLGGRHDATNVLGAPVLTNVSLDHTEALGETRELIAAEKLAVVRPGAVVVTGEPEWTDLARAQGASRVDHPGRSALALAGAAAEAYLSRPLAQIPHHAEQLPGRFERVSDRPLEIHDGAHNLAGVAWLLPRLPDRTFTLVASILADKDADSMLRALAQRAETLVATRSSSPRAIPADELAAIARPHFTRVESVPEPGAARLRAIELAGPEGAVLVAGSLYLLADLARDE